MQKKLFIFAFVFLGLFPAFSKANYFPNDAQTITFSAENTVSNGTLVVFPTGTPITVLEICAVSDSNYDVITAGGFNFLAVRNTLNYGQVCWRGSKVLSDGQNLSYDKADTAYKAISGFVTFVKYDLTAKTADNTLFSDIKDNVAGTNSALTGIHNDLTTTNAILNNINSSINSSSGASQTALLTLINENIISSNAKLDTTITATNNLYNLLNGGLLQDFLSWGIVAIYLGFSILFIRFIYRWFFGRL